MPDTDQAAPIVAAATPTTAPIVPVAPAADPAPAQPASAEVRMSSAELKSRLTETREKAAKDAAASIAADIGIPIAEAKALIAKAKEAEDKNKSDVERLTAKLAASEAKTAELDEYKGAVDVRAKVELGLLSEDQRAAVLAIAGEHPAKQLKTIETLRPTWQSIEQSRKAAEEAAAEAKRITDAAAAVAAAEAAKLPSAKAPIAAPATTAPTATAPVPTPPATTNHLAVYEHHQKTNPVRAANYYATNFVAIEAARKTA